MMSERFEQFKAAHPELNWQEAEEISDEVLTAAGQFFDKLLTAFRKGLKDGYKVSEDQG